MYSLSGDSGTAMTFDDLKDLLNYKPKSLSTYFPKESREFYQTKIDFIGITPDGYITLYKSGGSYGASLYLFNINDEGVGHWKYLVGKENLRFFLSLRKNWEEAKKIIQSEKLDIDSSDGNDGFNFLGAGYYIAVPEKNVGAQIGAARYPTAGLSKFFELVRKDINSVSLGVDRGSFIEGDYVGFEPIKRENYMLQYSYDDFLMGSEFADSIMGYRGKDTLKGNEGNDELYGGYGNDKLFGDDGNDILYGEQGVDRLEGGKGNDYLDGGLGADTLIGGAGDDTYIVDNKGDIITDNGLSSDKDTVLVLVYLSYKLPSNVESCELQGNFNSGVTGNDLNNDIQGNNGNNTLDGGKGNDKILGGAGSDTINGGVGTDELEGGTGNDTLTGGDGNDYVSGGEGNDTIIGGRGSDELTGGIGKDVFKFSASSGQGTDQIVDFQRGIDTIGIEKSGFGNLTKISVGASDSNNFGSGKNFHWNKTTGDLFFTGESSPFANVIGVNALTASDFLII